MSKYGVLICIRCHDYRRQDLVLGLILYALVPCHLFVAYIIELAAVSQAKGAIGRAKRHDQSSQDSVHAAKGFRATWIIIAWAHGINATLCLVVTSFTVYYLINHPLIGTIAEVHAIIVWLKICSYAFTNRDLRHAFLKPAFASTLPDLYSSCPYPRNITLPNLSYFWCAPTLVYQPIYPHTSNIRWLFVAKRLSEVFSLSIFIWLASAQYAAPLLHNSLFKIASLDMPSILERLMKLSTISLVIWLAGFFAIFQSALNALAEVMRFGDREFYSEWWNSPSVGSYRRTWNRPVNLFMRRHVYEPLVVRGWSAKAASAWVFVLSGVLHELLVGVPTHNILGIFHLSILSRSNDGPALAERNVILGVAFIGMLVQIPLIFVTLPLERMQGTNGKTLGNCIFWISFCLVGQPLAALLYFFAWQAKYRNSPFPVPRSYNQQIHGMYSCSLRFYD